MKKIHKQILSLAVAQVIQVPLAAKILTVQLQKGVEHLSGGYGQPGREEPYENLCVWYECNPERALEPRSIVLVGTGHDLPDTHTLRYISTVQQGDMVWHFYEAVT